MSRKASKENPCVHNDGVVCNVQHCDTCGWNPIVAKARMESILGKDAMAELKLYKVPFTGYCEVWAKSEEDADAKADGGEMFFAHYEFGDPICVEKEDVNELD